MSTDRTDRLAERIRQTLEDPESPLWFPDLTADLVEEGWRTLHARTGLTSDMYGTARVLTGDAAAPRRVLAEVPMGSADSAEQTRAVVETLNGEPARRYEELGLAFADPSEVKSLSVLQTLREAIALIHLVPSLGATVARLVRASHVLTAPAPDYDVSHSDPEVPFSIFFSIPGIRLPNDTVRVAESLIHEAMHLQLTLIQEHIELARAPHQTLQSPWKGGYRSIIGMVHGIYVFLVIKSAFDLLLDVQCLPPHSIQFIERRRKQIQSEFSQVNCNTLYTFVSEPISTFMHERLANL